MCQLSELLPHEYSFDFGTAQLKLRYDMTALLSLEREGLEYKAIFANEITAATVLAFLHAGLTEDIGKEREIAVMTTLGIEKTWEHCRAAVVLSLPKYDPLVIPEENRSTNDGNMDYSRLRSLICDVMQKDEEFFWRSTLSELLQRWQDYAVLKGYAKPPKKVQLYDTEGMN